MSGCLCLVGKQLTDISVRNVIDAARNLLQPLIATCREQTITYFTVVNIHMLKVWYCNLELNSNNSTIFNKLRVRWRKQRLVWQTRCGHVTRCRRLVDCRLTAAGVNLNISGYRTHSVAPPIVSCVHVVRKDTRKFVSTSS